MKFISCFLELEANDEKTRNIEEQIEKIENKADEIGEQRENVKKLELDNQKMKNKLDTCIKL